MVQLLPCKHRPWMQKQPNQGTEPPCIVTSPVLCQYQPNNGEKSESRFIDLSLSFLNVRYLQCANVVLQVKNVVNQIGVYET